VAAEAYAALRKTAFWIPFVIATVFALSPKGVPLPFSVTDVALHLFAFVYLSAALGVAYFDANGARWIAFWMLAYGAAIEIIQSFLPSRSAEMKDLLVDVAGIAIGVIVWRYVLVPLERRAQS